MKRKPTKSHLIIGTVVLTSVFSLAFVEASLRILDISYPVFHAYDPLRGKRLVPKKEGWYRSEGEAYIRINSAGFRDTEHDIQKKEGTYRIAILGDSYIEARQVALEHTFGRRLEDYLHTCQPDQFTAIETLSFGQGGYSTTDELLTLQYDVWPYDPDMVLTSIFHGNDLIDNFPTMTECSNGECPHIQRPYYYFDHGKLKLDTSFREWSFTSLKDRLLLAGVQYSRTLEVLNQIVRVINNWRVTSNTAFAFQETGVSEWVYAPPQTPQHLEAWKITEGILELLNQEVTEHHAQPFWMLVTNPSQIDPKQQQALKQHLGVNSLDYPDQRFMELGKRLGVPVVPLIYPFLEHAEKHQEYLHGFPNYRMGAGHWNEKGHDLAARIVANRICQHLMSKDIQ